MTFPQIKLCYITEDIFLGRTPVYSEEKNQNYIIGQKNNQKNGIDFTGVKFGEDAFYKGRSKKEFLNYGDILLNTLGTGSVGRIGYWNISDSNQYITDGHIMVIRTKDTADSRFVYYSLFVQQRELEDAAVGSTNQAFLTVTDIYKRTIPFPKIEMQRRIADFLDSKCSEIDDILEKTRASIEEYKKLKQFVITEVVTKGIRGNRSMKDSGIKWVESLPFEWEPINPKVLFTQRKEKAHPGERQLASSQQYGIIYQDDYMALTGAKIVTVEKDFDILKHVEAGDFVISMRSFQGGLEYSENTGSISSAYVMLKPNPHKVYNRFYKWLFKSQVYIDALCSTSNMVRDGQAMRYSNFAQVRLYTVPMEEQQEIAAYLDEKCTAIDSLIASKEALITELEAYKKSIIYEYVTGKKEVI